MKAEEARSGTQAAAPGDRTTRMIQQERPDTPEARTLIAELDALLHAQYPLESCHGYSVEKLIADDVAFFVVRENGAAAGCGGIKLVGQEYGELKRMYVRPAYRGRGLAKSLLNHLAAFALSRHVPLLRLETGIHQHEAIRLYEQWGFVRIPPFGPYTDDPVSRCYEKCIA